MRAAVVLASLAVAAVLVPGATYTQDNKTQQEKDKDKEVQTDSKKAKPPKPVRVFTNDDLERGKAETAGSTPSSPPATPPAGTAPAARATPRPAVTAPRETPLSDGESGGERGPGSDGAGDGVSAEESDFRSRLAALKAAVAAAEEQVKSLEESSTQVFWETLRSTDTNEILRLKAEQGETAASLEKARKQVETSKQQLADFETEARRAGVPLHWYRDPPK
jgi:hypothetical protein